MVWFLTGAMVAVVVTLMFVNAFRAEAAPGDTDTTFVPISPGCRFADTRQPGQGPMIGDGQTRVFTAHGTNNACTIPADAVGLLMNVTVDGQTAANSFLTIWGNGPNPGTSALNPAAGEPPTPNAVTTDLTAGGQFKIYNDAGSVNVIIDIGGYYTNTSLVDLHQRVATLEATLASVSATTVDGHPTVRFTGVNVQVVDGTGTSACTRCTGRGNLIVGYNEDDFSVKARSGSHNIVVGTDNDWTSHSGIVAGQFSEISGEYATVTGGASNTASGGWASVSGGSGNTASNVQASVSGGIFNEADGPYSSVSGGASNTASGARSSVSGGSGNTANGDQTVILGGAECTDGTINGVIVGNTAGTLCTQLN